MSELVQAQSFSSWLLSAFLLFLKQEQFQQNNKALFDKFTNVLSSITYTQSDWTFSIQAFLTLVQRKSVLNRLLPSVKQHHKDDLLCAPVFSDLLFDPETLERVIGEHSKSQSDQSKAQMAKFISSNSFSKAFGSSSFSGRGSRRPYSRPYFATRGKGGRGGRGRGRAGAHKQNPSRKAPQKQQKMPRAVTLA